MQYATVVVIGGGATGTGILRDLAMRGIKAVLLEQRDLAYGTSSRFHGLLHSGGRYAVKDPESARECIEENRILRRIGRYCVEETEGFFVRLPEDDEKYEQQWVESCARLGIPAVPISPQEARRLEPCLSPRIKTVYRVPDAAIDGFRLVWQNAASAARYGGSVRTYSEVIKIEHVNNRVVRVKVRNTLTGETDAIACDYVINAAGPWVGQVGALAGVTVDVKPDRGTLIAFNHRLSNRVINRLRPPSDADIFVPHGTVTILGTTSVPTDRPDDFQVRTEDVLSQLRTGQVLFEDLERYRILRAFAGTRPLYSADAKGRAAARTFAVIDHAKTDGLYGFISVAGGKLTTYRLMAEKTVDVICQYLNIKEPCRTAVEPLVPEHSPEKINEARRYFPAFGAEKAVARLGSDLDGVLNRLKHDNTARQLVCECELVTLGELREVAAGDKSFCLDDIRRKTRMGMGTCQGTFCALRSVGAVVAEGLEKDRTPCGLLKDFLQSRWSGIRPVLWGSQLREAELMRAVYGATLNIDGVVQCERK
ncbi:anaerobic glycerol-3-phosphate dehydrogenase subunit GlpA [Sporolituus thermophilus]|uniref:Glycerol 3-phosphate dehydrogenase (Quinone) subunit A n=1 Tax=Sporolituus thermophilus DSM 23256 TaxID=1123285 RepID=A0A1G7M4L8_9FIRM|nr:anaerobic glycerol-3-phosphate dehydrogenase subunit GlpA [Sporolituus thermophilus]SDF56695.1 glycerol 3-phosphate dehydrogenase (quinone) subunit A [Sporolituus thermophilus DSM 23256]